MKKIFNDFVKAMKEEGLTLALAESITCGMAAEKLATCFGTSDVLRGAIVCYTPEVKYHLMRIPKKTMEKYTCESMQVTELLAKNLKPLIKADVYAALTGLASPGGSETKSKPVGTVFLCIIHKNRSYKRRLLFRGTPVEIRKKACMAIYDLIMEKVIKK
jgi:nicotinamide-nucleotide amidase